MDSPTEIAALTMREWRVSDSGKTYSFRLALHNPGTDADADKSS
jgi:predicted metalloprotease with PDZ domain